MSKTHGALQAVKFLQILWGFGSKISQRNSEKTQFKLQDHNLSVLARQDWSEILMKIAEICCHLCNGIAVVAKLHAKAAAFGPAHDPFQKPEMLIFNDNGATRRSVEGGVNFKPKPGMRNVNNPASGELPHVKDSAVHTTMASFRRSHIHIQTLFYYNRHSVIILWLRITIYSPYLLRQ